MCVIDCLAYFSLCSSLIGNSRLRKILGLLPERAQKYVVASRNGEDLRQQEVWYIEDEVGAAVRDSDAASAHVGLIVCLTLGGQAFSVLFLTRSLEQGWLKDMVLHEFHFFAYFKHDYPQFET